MTLQVSIRPQIEGDAIYALESTRIVNKGDGVDYSDNHAWHTVAAAAPDADLTFSPMSSMWGATRGGVVIFSVYQDNSCAVINGVGKKAGDTFPLKGMIFSVEQIT